MSGISYALVMLCAGDELFLLCTSLLFAERQTASFVHFLSLYINVFIYGTCTILYCKIGHLNSNK